MSGRRCALGSSMTPSRRIELEGGRSAAPARRCSSIRGPAAGPGLGSPRRPETAGSTVAGVRPGSEPRDGDRRGRSRRRGRAGGGGRRWVAGDASRAAALAHDLPFVCVPAGNPQPLRPRPRPRSGRSNRRPRRPQRWRRGPDRRRGGERPRLSQQRLARHLRRGDSSRGVSRREGPHVGRDRAHRPRPGRRDLRTGRRRRPRRQPYRSGDRARVEQPLRARAGRSRAAPVRR